MPFTHDFSGVNEAGSFMPMPDSRQVFRIGKKEYKTTPKGYPRIEVDLTVEDGEFKGRKVFHSVTFFPQGEKGAGFSKRWLHAIGEPYEGNVQVNYESWEGLIVAEVRTEKYQGKNKEGKIVEKTKNIIKEVVLPEEDDDALDSVANAEMEESEPDTSIPASTETISGDEAAKIVDEASF